MAERYIPHDCKKAIIFLKQLAELTDNNDYNNLHRLSLCLLKRGDLSEAKKYLQILADQKDWPGFSIYAQLILREKGLMNEDLNLQFVREKKFLERHRD